MLYDQFIRLIENLVPEKPFDVPYFLLLLHKELTFEVLDALGGEIVAS